MLKKSHFYNLLLILSSITINISCSEDFELGLGAKADKPFMEAFGQNRKEDGVHDTENNHSDVQNDNQNNSNTINHVVQHSNKAIDTREIVQASQFFLGKNDVELRLQESLPEIYYTTDSLSILAKTVNQANWTNNTQLDRATTIKIQALLNWNGFGVGAVDGKMSANTIKAIKSFQKAKGIKGGGTMTALTWQLLTANEKLVKQPALINYMLTKDDVSLPRQHKNTQYRSVREAIAEKFHMSQRLLGILNPNTPLKAGKMITVYNPGQPNTEAVQYIDVFKRSNLMVLYDKNKQILGSYPTTIGNRTPNGTHKVVSRVHKPYYNSNFANRNATKPPGPNNPVGLVWLGLSKPSFGLHGSPEPEMISRQRSAGCVRLTNWDVLGLYGTIQDKAVVRFFNE